jgi:hypothetical protein
MPNVPRRHWRSYGNDPREVIVDVEPRRVSQGNGFMVA